MSNLSTSIPVSPPLEATNKPITLQVGERYFITVPETLTSESAFFAALLSGRWGNNASPDGSIFIDADAALFEHILRYLRRGVLPLFYDNVKGHDHALYIALLTEAQYFQIPRLETWLKEKKYLEAVTIHRWVEDIIGETWVDKKSSEQSGDEFHTPRFVVRKIHLCSRGIAVHRGNPEACGRLCKDVAEKAGGFKSEEYSTMKTLVVRKKVVVDFEACVAGWEGEMEMEMDANQQAWLAGWGVGLEMNAVQNL